MRAVMGDGIETLPRLRRHEQWLFLKLWVRFQKTLHGDATAQLSKIAFRLGCHTIARNLLEHGHDRSEHLFAIMAPGYMRDRSAWDLLCAQLALPSSTISLYAAWALLQIAPEQAAGIVISSLLVRDDWEIVRASTLLRDSRGVLSSEMARHFSKPGVLDMLARRTTERLPQILRMAQALRLQIDPTVLQPLLDTDQPPDILIGALRLISSSRGVEAVRSHIAHPDWRVRVQVARSLGQIGDASDVPRLTVLLQDPEWWVRYRAAQALIRLPFVSRAELDALSGDFPDRYAREILQQVLAESRGNR
jgi:HEAT repeat protein